MPISTRRAQHGGQGGQRLVMVSTLDAQCTCTSAEMVDSLFLALRQAAISQDIASAVRLAYTHLPAYATAGGDRIQQAGWRLVDAIDSCRYSIGPDDHDRAIVLQVRNTRLTVHDGCARSTSAKLRRGPQLPVGVAVDVSIRDFFTHSLPAIM